MQDPCVQRIDNIVVWLDGMSLLTTNWKTRDMLNEYWIKLWDISFCPTDYDLDSVMDNLSIKCANN